MWTVVFAEDAEVEYDRLSHAERAAMQSAIEKLIVEGPLLGAPHSSSVRGSRIGLRELRPRAGRSPTRALYRRVSDFMVIGAICPEADNDRRGFDRGIANAERRLAPYLEEAE